MTNQDHERQRKRTTGRPPAMRPCGPIIGHGPRRGNGIGISGRIAGSRDDGRSEDP